MKFYKQSNQRYLFMKSKLKMCEFCHSFLFEVHKSNLRLNRITNIMRYSDMDWINVFPVRICFFLLGSLDTDIDIN